MSQKEPNTTDGQSEQTGSAKLVSELQLYFAIYAKDLKTVREKSGEVELLHDEQTFDIVVKLLSVLDKIKKLDVVDVESDENKPAEAKVRNLQDLVLKGKKA